MTDETQQYTTAVDVGEILHGHWEVVSNNLDDRVELLNDTSTHDWDYDRTLVARPADGGYVVDVTDDDGTVIDSQEVASEDDAVRAINDLASKYV